MLNRKTKSPARQSKHHSHGRNRAVVNKTPRPVRRRFVISSKSASASHTPARTVGTHNGHNKSPKLAKGSKVAPHQKTPGAPLPNNANTPPGTVDLTETVKTLLHIAQENGYV